MPKKCRDLHADEAGTFGTIRIAATTLAVEALPAHVLLKINHSNQATMDRLDAFRTMPKGRRTGKWQRRPAAGMSNNVGVFG
jgi:hypothetical protein